MKLKVEERASISISTRLRLDLVKRMERVAERKDWSMSQLVRNALEEYCKHPPKNGH